MQKAFVSREESNTIKSGIADMVLFFLFNFDRAYEDGLWRDWPEIPWLVIWGLIGVARLLDPGWWKFASCAGKG